MNNAFLGASNLIMSATDAPDLSQVTDLYTMFGLATSFNSDISSWNVSSITDIGGMFQNASSFNQDISSWDVSKVKRMDNIFRNAISFNGDISSWNVSSVTDMSFMFSNADNYSQANYDKLLEGWSQLNLQSNVAFGAPPTYYCNVEARNILTTNFSWTIAGERQGTNEQCNP